MGEVFRAHDQRLDREVALKVIAADVERRPGASQRFEHEARAASALNHSNIVTIYDVGEEGGRPFIVMELLDGQSLRQFLSAPLSTDLLLRLAVQIADGLTAAHERGIVHRDLKPENIFVTRQGTAKILDFGLARICEPDCNPISNVATVERLTHGGIVVGTAGYAAPEALSGKNVDTRADLFSFGAILYEMACGTPAFHGQTAMETLAATLRDEPEPVTARRPNVPPAIRRVIERCLAKVPEHRYSSTQELRDELRALLAVGTETTPPRRRRRRLPAPRTALIGREEELGRLRSLIVDEGARLVTLTGPGGGGKTRLALAAAEKLTPHFREEELFVPLGAVRDPELVCTAIAEALGVSVGAGESPLHAVIAELNAAGAPMLLVLDNFEQVISAAETVSELLAACPAVSFIVTSREVLHLYGEYDVPVPPLTVPEAESDMTPEQLAQTAAVALFIARARAVDPSFRLTADNAGAVVEICRRLDGLPLALELAAARVRTLPPQALVARLGQRLELLTTGARDLPDRQHTMRRAIDWSYGLLTPAEQTLLRRLSAFVGSFTLEGAEAVSDPYQKLAVEAVDGVASLVDKSLLQKQEVEGGGARFGMLETIREYARSLLNESEDEPLTLRAHAAYFLVLAEEGARVLATAENAEWLSVFAREHDNFRAALDWLIKTGNAEWGLRMALGLFHFWERAEHLSEGRKWTAALLELSAVGLDDGLRARAYFAIGVLASAQGDYNEAILRTEMSLALYRGRDDPRGLAVAHNSLGILYSDVGDFDRAARHLETSLVTWREANDDTGYARSLSNFAFVRRKQRQYDQACRLYDEAAGIFDRAGDRLSSAWALNHQGGVATDQKLWDEATRFYERALEAFRLLGDNWGIASTVVDLGTIAREQGDQAQAEERYREALSAFLHLGHRRGVARVLESMAVLAGQKGASERALVLSSAAAALRQKLGVPGPITDQAELSRWLQTAREGVESRVAEEAQRRGALMSLPEVVRYAQLPV
jgi:predicted ATPase/predicted Ser/Thr protein kinase